MKKRTGHLRCGEANVYEYVGENEGRKQKKMVGGVSRAGEERVCNPFVKEDNHSHT